jgi:hypothetical protein
VNLYGQGRDMKMAYGNLSVFPQPGGGVQSYDRWKVDKANDVYPSIEKIEKMRPWRQNRSSCRLGGRRPDSFFAL